MKVLYATDGSEAAFAAKSLLTKLFRRDKTIIKVVSVTHSWSFDPGHIVLELDPIAERRGDSHRIVDAAAADLKDAGFEVSTAVLEGVPSLELVKLAKSGYDLVIVGAGSHSWLGNRLLGSVSTYLLHEAPCSVLIVHEAPMAEGHGHVLVGVDGSNTSDETMSMLTRVLDPSLCDVGLMSAVPYQLPVVAPVLVGPTTDQKTLAPADAELLKQAETQVQKWAEAFRDAGFRTSTRVERGGAAPVLLEEAKQTDADLIAVGSRGLGPIRSTFLGSVSDQIARLSRSALIGRFDTDHEFERGDEG